jgi:hypothetical protein
MHHQVSPVGSQAFVLLTRFGSQHIGADHKVTQRALRTSRHFDGGK